MQLVNIYIQNTETRIVCITHWFTSLPVEHSGKEQCAWVICWLCMRVFTSSLLAAPASGLFLGATLMSPHRMILYFLYGLSNTLIHVTLRPYRVIREKVTVRWVERNTSCKLFTASLLEQILAYNVTQGWNVLAELGSDSLGTPV